MTSSWQIRLYFSAKILRGTNELIAIGSNKLSARIQQRKQILHKKKKKKTKNESQVKPSSSFCFFLLISFPFFFPPPSFLPSTVFFLLLLPYLQKRFRTTSANVNAIVLHLLRIVNKAVSQEEFQTTLKTSQHVNTIYLHRVIPWQFNLTLFFELFEVGECKVDDVLTDFESVCDASRSNKIRTQLGEQRSVVIFFYFFFLYSFSSSLLSLVNFWKRIASCFSSFSPLPLLLPPSSSSASPPFLLLFFPPSLLYYSLLSTYCSKKSASWSNIEEAHSRLERELLQTYRVHMRRTRKPNE